MDKRIKYDFRDHEAFSALLFPAIFIPLYFSEDFFFVLKLIVFYIFPAWLFLRFSYSSMRVTAHAIIIVKYLKPFKKTRRYNLTDLSAVSIGSYKRQWKIGLRFADEKRFSAGLYYNVEEICLFFLDKGIEVGSADENLRHFIAHYHNDPKANLIRRRIRRAKRRSL